MISPCVTGIFFSCLHVKMKDSYTVLHLLETRRRKKLQFDFFVLSLLHTYMLCIKQTVFVFAVDKFLKIVYMLWMKSFPLNIFFFISFYDTYKCIICIITHSRLRFSVNFKIYYIDKIVRLDFFLNLIQLEKYSNNHFE